MIKICFIKEVMAFIFLLYRYINKDKYLNNNNNKKVFGKK